MIQHQSLLLSALLFVPILGSSCSGQDNAGGGTGAAAGMGVGGNTGGTTVVGGTTGRGGASGGAATGLGGMTSLGGSTSVAGTNGGAAAGGATTGGAAAGGAATGGSKATGGAAAGGAAATGGTKATGGAATGGATTGGAATGGTKATGGVTAGGATTGGAATGGTKATGGAATGGAATGGGAGTGTCVGADKTGAANINLSTVYQNIRGYGGANIPGFINDLTSSQVDTAFGNGSGQIGMSILRIRVPYDESKFNLEVSTAKRAASHDAIVIASPWTPPANMKTNNNTIGGRLSTASYGAYADHLVKFRDYMNTNGAPLYGISVQNEPDITVTYESCFWDSTEMANWIKAQGSKFGSTKLMAAESAHFDQSLTDPILNDSSAAALVGIVAGHIYDGLGLADYPLARDKGKEVWMTEHYTESSNSADAWPLALDVGKEINDCMVANYSAYVWWYIRRSYGPIAEDGHVSKRGYLIAQYAKFVRPGFARIDATAPSNSNVFVTAYKKDTQVVVVAVNMDTSSQTITLNIRNGCVGSFSKYTTSGSKNVSSDGTVTLTENASSVTLDAQSVTTFVSN